MRLLLLTTAIMTVFLFSSFLELTSIMPNYGFGSGSVSPNGTSADPVYLANQTNVTILRSNPSFNGTFSSVSPNGTSADPVYLANQTNVTILRSNPSFNGTFSSVSPNGTFVPEANVTGIIPVDCVAPFKNTTPYVIPRIDFEVTGVRANNPPELELPNTILEGRPIMIDFKIRNFENYPILGEVWGVQGVQIDRLGPLQVRYSSVLGVAPPANANAPITLLFYDRCAPQTDEFGRTPIASTLGQTPVAARYYLGFRQFESGYRYLLQPPMGYGLFAKSIGDNPDEHAAGEFLGYTGNGKVVNKIIGPFNLVPNDRTKLGLSFVLAQVHTDLNNPGAVLAVGAKLAEGAKTLANVIGLTDWVTPIGWGARFLSIVSEVYGPLMKDDRCDGPRAGYSKSYNSIELEEVTRPQWPIYPVDIEFDLPYPESRGINHEASRAPGVATLVLIPSYADRPGLFNYYYTVETPPLCGKSPLYHIWLDIFRVPPEGMMGYNTHLD